MPAHELMKWLRSSSWHYAVRLPCDVLLQGASRYPGQVGSLHPRLSEACLYRQIALWADGAHRCNLVLATVPGAKDSWAVATDESKFANSLAICLEVLRRGVFLDKSGAFELADSRLRSTDALERLY